MTNASGTISWKALHNAYGYAEVDASSTVTNNIRFPGQYYDTESGYHYNQNRYYDPRTGRYITADPIGLEGGINPYVYVDDAPVNRIDSLGLSSKEAVDWAKSKRGSFDYWYFASNSDAGGRSGHCFGGHFSPKCNFFVFDALKQGNCAPQRMPDGRIPGACDWADPNAVIKNCPVLKAGEQLTEGDVVALRNNNGTCHVGLYSPIIDKSGNLMPGTISAREHRPIAHNDWAFRTGDQPTIRRCKCSCQ